MHGADGHGALDRETRQRTPMGAEPRREQRLGLDRDGVGDEAAAGPQRGEGRREDARIAGTAAEEDSVGRRLAGEAFRRLAYDDGETGHAEERGIASGAGGTVLAGL